MKHITYENRYVAFLDVLGTKNQILKSNSPDWIVNSLEEIADAFNSYKYQQLEGEIEISLFSDSIIYSVKEGKNAFLKICMFVEVAYYTFLKKGFLIRGGISFGELYHRNNIAVGPALIEAYQLEGKSEYPRCILKEELFVKGLHELKDIKPCLYINEFINLTNGYFMIDYLRANIRLLDFSGENACEYMQGIRTLICTNLDIHYNNSKIYEKYNWLAEYFNKTLIPHKMEIMKDDTKLYNQLLEFIHPIKLENKTSRE